MQSLPGCTIWHWYNSPPPPPPKKKQKKKEFCLLTMLSHINVNCEKKQWEHCGSKKLLICYVHCIILQTQKQFFLVLITMGRIYFPLPTSYSLSCTHIPTNKDVAEEIVWSDRPSFEFKSQFMWLLVQKLSNLKEKNFIEVSCHISWKGCCRWSWKSEIKLSCYGNVFGERLNNCSRC